MSVQIYVGDVHGSSHQYGTRLDNSTETFFEKLKYVLDKAKELSAPVIFTGDFLDNNNNSKTFLLRLLRLLKYSGVDCYTIGGNHEMRGTSFESYLDSQIQFLFEAGALKFLDSNSKDLEVPGGLIRGFSAYSTLNTDNAGSVIGLVVHHFLVDSFDDTLVCYPSQMKKIFPNLKFIVAGHDHSYYPVSYTPEGVALIRPGSLMRISSDKANNRKPLYVEYHLEEQQVYYREVPAKKYSELFDLTSKQEKKEVQSAVDRFILDMKSQTRTGVDLAGIFRSRLNSIDNPQYKEYIHQDLIEHGFLT